MFKKIKMRDLLKIHPRDFDDKHSDTIMEAVSHKYVNKALQKQGLVVAVAAIDDVGTPAIRDGHEFVSVAFTLVVFMPFVDEVIEGELLGSDASGLQISLKFFRDVYVAKDDLPEEVNFDKSTSTWSWDYEGHTMTYSVGERIRFRVKSVAFAPRSEELNVDRKLFSERNPPMRVEATAVEDGLGLVDWWNP